ncbi:unnamed protein product [Trichogramma brassicae]|uniref:Uncharacterized protein n=1 Tax=Trichogramma brassicae TaxID=86971 RepID=A0A6H5J410_9HYME|nr:unnamed protein product [Trichogramma brassicae]
MASSDTNCLENLKSLRQKVSNWELETERHDFLLQLDPLISDWQDQLPNLREIFTNDEIETLLFDAVDLSAGEAGGVGGPGSRFVAFVIGTGYRDELKLDENGRILLPRTTPIHRAYAVKNFSILPDLFEIYDRFDEVIYNKRVLSHFSVACIAGLDEVVKKFLDAGQNPNCIWPKKGDSPLLLTVDGLHKKTAELLLRHRATSHNYSNGDRSTLLHLVAKKGDSDEAVEFTKMFFEINAEMNRTVEVDTRDRYGRTPLNLALELGHGRLAEVLLRHGADPTFPNKDGATPLHVISARDDAEDLAKLFFEFCEDENRPMLIDARDDSGLTPLQWAVANFVPAMIDLLLDKGADLTSFVFPTYHYSAEAFQAAHRKRIDVKSRLLTRVLGCVERLEKRGHRLEPRDALTIVKLFRAYRLLHDSNQLSEAWRVDENFVSLVERCPFKPGLSFHDLIRLRLDEASKLYTVTDLLPLLNSAEFSSLTEKYRDRCVNYLSEIMTRGFLRRWTPTIFEDLARYELPTHCCQKVIQMLNVSDLRKICLAAEIVANEESQIAVIHRYQRCPKMVTSGVKGPDVYDDYDSDAIGESNLEKLESMRKKLNWENEQERYKFLREFISLSYGWYRSRPNFEEMFRPEEIDWLLIESLKIADDYTSIWGVPLVKLMTRPRCHYKDKPVVDNDGKPTLRRTTAVHLAGRRNWTTVIPGLFQIYNRFDVNYTDEDGYTHFHAASQSGCDDVVEKFLELGQDPNCQSYALSPLNLALMRGHKKVTELLLRSGADPNSPDGDGQTPLHIIGKGGLGDDLPELFFEICDEKQQTVQIDARDVLGNTPLHEALTRDNKKAAELLLRIGADPKLATNDALTPLHLICKYTNGDDLAKTFFAISDEKHQSIQVDARDEFGRTPLQLAVASLSPDVIEILLNRGANLTGFVFPTSSYFGKKFDATMGDNDCYKGNFKIKLASGTLAVVELLEKRGYELDRSDALTIMQFFNNCELFNKSVDLKKRLHSHEDFTSKSKQVMVRSDLSFYKLIQLRPEEVEKILTYTDYFKFINSNKLCELPEDSLLECNTHLCEIILRSFCRQWALEFYLELTDYRLPIPCCEMIIDQLQSQDLIRLCLAAEIDAVEDSQTHDVHDKVRARGRYIARLARSSRRGAVSPAAVFATRSKSEQARRRRRRRTSEAREDVVSRVAPRPRSCSRSSTDYHSCIISSGFTHAWHVAGDDQVYTYTHTIITSRIHIYSENMNRSVAGAVLRTASAAPAAVVDAGAGGTSTTTSSSSATWRSERVCIYAKAAAAAAAAQPTRDFFSTVRCCFEKRNDSARLAILEIFDGLRLIPVQRRACTGRPGHRLRYTHVLSRTRVRELKIFFNCMTAEAVVVDNPGSLALLHRVHTMYCAELAYTHTGRASVNTNRLKYQLSKSWRSRARCVAYCLALNAHRYTRIHGFEKRSFGCRNYVRARSQRYTTGAARVPEKNMYMHFFHSYVYTSSIAIYILCRIREKRKIKQKTMANRRRGAQVEQKKERKKTTIKIPRSKRALLFSRNQCSDARGSHLYSIEMCQQKKSDLYLLTLAIVTRSYMLGAISITDLCYLLLACIELLGLDFKSSHVSWRRSLGFFTHPTSTGHFKNSLSELTMPCRFQICEAPGDRHYRTRPAFELNVRQFYSSGTK